MNNANRISREICNGVRYCCMFCKQRGEDVVWEYDEVERQVIAVTCVDVGACGDRQAARDVYEGF